MASILGAHVDYARRLCGSKESERYNEVYQYLNSVLSLNYAVFLPLNSKCHVIFRFYAEMCPKIGKTVILADPMASKGHTAESAVFPELFCTGNSLANIYLVGLKIILIIVGH
jgi:hypothetical protein